MAKQVDSTNIGTLLEALITKIKSFFWRKDETSELPIDNTPTSGSNNLVKSGGVYSALAAKYTKPSGGIPASDLASGVIPDVSQFITRSVNDLVNYYLKSEVYTKDEVASLIGSIQQFHYEIAASTSAVTDPSNNVLYLIGPTGSGADKYEEYVYDATKPVAERWVKIGDTSIDLSNYVTLDALNDALADTVAGLATVARSGSYNDLLNKPDIPADKVFIAEFDVTPYADVLAAVNDNSKVVFCQFLGLMIPYISKDNDGTIRFGLIVEKQDKSVGVDEYLSYIFWVDTGFGWNFAMGRRKPFLDTTSDSALATNASESLMQTVKLHKVSKTGNYNDLLNKPTIPPADYVAMIDITSSVDGSGNVNVSAAIVSGTFAEIDAALLAQKTVLLIGRYPNSHVSYQYFRCGEHRSAAEIVFTSTGGGEWFRGLVTAATWYPAANGEPERVLVEDATGILGFSPTGDGNAVTSIEKNPLLPLAVVNKDKTFVDTAQQTLTDAQKSQARTNIGAGTYSKPANGIPASDLANGVIPTVPEDNVFIAEWNVTPYADVLAAINGGKMVFCKCFGKYYPYSYSIEINNKTYYRFVLVEETLDGTADMGVVQNTLTILSLSSSGWGLASSPRYPFLDTTSETALNPAQDESFYDTIHLHKVSKTGNYNDLLNKPTVPTTYAGSPTAGGFANKAVANPFGSVDSDSTATDIKATVDNFPTTITDGVCAYIRNDVVASASGFTLNINGTGAKPVYQTMADASRATTIFSAAVTYLFIYNSTRVEGGCWDIYYGYNSNDNTIGYNLRTNTMSLPTTSACYRYRLLFTSADGTHFVPANASTSTNATSKRTTTQTPIDPFGSIRYYSSTSAVSSGARPGATSLWEQYLVTLGYSFNRTGAALTLTAWKPVYIKCAPQADGSAIIEEETPYVQDLPTTADGKIYIFLGVATSATQVEVVFHHPVYYHDGTRVTNWPGPVIGDIQTALDAIIGKSLNSFTIGGTTYQAEDGMTWEDWVDSEYNTGNYFIFTGDDTLKYITKGGTGQGAIMYGQDFVRPGETIIEDGVYQSYGGIIEG